MDVLVVGGGIAGLALARALRRQDVPVTVAERGDDDGGGLAINLPGNAITAFAVLGLSDGLSKLGRPTERREYRSSRDRLLFTVDEDAFWGPEARPRCVRRSDLLSLLSDGLDVTIRRSLPVTSVRPVAGGADVEFGDDTSQRFGFVAGADGVRSVVRATAIGAAATTRPALLSAASWRFMAPNPGVDCWTLWTGPGGAFLLIPVDDQQVYGYASATGGGPVSADAAWLRTSFRDYPAPVRTVLDALAVPSTPTVPGTPTLPGTSAVPGSPGVPGTPSVPGTPASSGVPGDFGISGAPGFPDNSGASGASGVAGFPDVLGSPGLPGASGALDATTRLYHSPIEEVRAPSWSAGRCVLVGDAAHATSPVWAQGAALAAEDALVLAELLATTDWDDAGAHYERLRRDRVAHVQAATDRFSRVAALPTWLRHALLPAIGPRSYRDTFDPLRHPFPTP